MKKTPRIREYVLLIDETSSAGELRQFLLANGYGVMRPWRANEVLSFVDAIIPDGMILRLSMRCHYAELCESENTSTTRQS